MTKNWTAFHFFNTKAIWISKHFVETAKNQDNRKNVSQQMGHPTKYCVTFSQEHFQFSNVLSTDRFRILYFHRAIGYRIDWSSQVMHIKLEVLKTICFLLCLHLRFLCGIYLLWHATTKPVTQFASFHIPSRRCNARALHKIFSFFVCVLYSTTFGSRKLSMILFCTRLNWCYLLYSVDMCLDVNLNGTFSCWDLKIRKLFALIIHLSFNDLDFQVETRRLYACTSSNSLLG